MTLQPRQNRRPRATSRSGAVLVEFAIVLPIFLLAIIGIIEFGRAVMVQQICVNAAREGARRAIVPDEEHDDVIDAVNDYLDNADQLIAASRTKGNRVVEILGPDGAPASLEDIVSKQAVMVRVALPYDDVGVGFSAWFTDANLGAVVQMRRE